MEQSKPAVDSVCPLCGHVPEVFSENHYPFIWSGMTECFICEFCHMELAIEFYEDNSRYFELASRLLNLDVWECKKRYLEYVIKTTEATLAESGEEDSEYVAFLTDRIQRCKLQVDAIERFQKTKSMATSQNELDREYQQLQEALSVPAFGIDFAVPNLITIEFE